MHVRDQSRLAKLSKVVGPSYAKVASDQSYSEGSTAAVYADRANSLYPCHSKTAAYQSAILAADDGVTDTTTLAELKKFASFWDIEVAVAEATAKVAATKVVATIGELPDSDFALVQDHQGAKVRKFASYDAPSTVEAAEAFYANRAKFPFAWRKTAAERLLASASTHAAILPAYVHTYLLKASCAGRPTTESVDEGIRQRLNLTHRRDREVAEKLATVLNDVATQGATYSQAKLAAVFELVDACDREVKIASAYEDGKLSLPEEMLVVERVAKTAATSVRLVNGVSVNVGKLPKAALASVDDSLATMSLSKLADVLPTLPKPDADLLVRMMPKGAADMGALTDDNFSSQTSAPAMAPPPAAAAAPAAPAAPATPGPDMSKMQPIASGAASNNFASNGSNMPQAGWSPSQTQAYNDNASAAAANLGLSTNHGSL